MLDPLILEHVPAVAHNHDDKKSVFKGRIHGYLSKLKIYLKQNLKRLLSLLLDVKEAQRRGLTSQHHDHREGLRTWFLPKFKYLPGFNKNRESYRSEGQVQLFSTSNDCMALILSYLTIKSISHLDIAMTNTAARIIWLNVLHVMNVDIFDEYDHHDASINWLLGRDISLRSLKIKNGERVRIDCCILLGINMLSLREISLSNCNIIESDILSMVHCCPHLIDICLRGCDGVTDISIRAIGECCHEVASLDIGGCHKITDYGLTGFADACRNFSDAGTLNHTSRLQSSSSSLTKMNLRDCRNITDIGISAIALHCHQLSFMNLTGCINVTDNCVSALGRHCHNLRTMILCGCTNISGPGLSALDQICPLLTEINLAACRNITDTGVSALAQHCPNLMKINLSRCTNITDISVSAVARYCYHLNDINLAGCTNITDISASALGQYCPNLNTINLCCCERVTDIGALALAVQCPKLLRISVVDCFSITRHCVIILRRDYPLIQIN